jgi:cob(I)alamin adenosyltransferase
MRSSGGGQQQEIDYVEAERGWEIARTAIASGLYKTIILDELNPTVDLELLPEDPIVQSLLRKPKRHRGDYHRALQKSPRLL